MAAARKSKTDIYVAKVAFHAEVGGENVFVRAGERVRAGHPILDAQPDYFELADETIRDSVPEVEQATAAPGEKRGG